jgi:hypothetical protein
MTSILIICLTAAALFGIAWYYTRSWLTLTAAGLWAAFPPYNYSVLARCSGDCNIRIDLLVVAPIMLGASVLALMTIGVHAWHRWRDSREDT